MSYFLRLTCVCLASFFLVHIAIGLAVLATSSLAARFAEKMRPASGARMLFVLRVLPLSLSLLAVIVFCVPSYLRFEQDASESIGYPCLLLSLAGLGLVGAAATRLVSAFTQNPRDAVATRPGPLFALVGILRPRLMVSHLVRQVLTENQMEAALLHEEAHRQAHDNLKRLAIVASPGVLPLHPTFRTLEQHWARMAEWAADDAAVASEPMRAIALAEALVQVARISTCREGFPVLSSLVASKNDLGERVQRLLLPHIEPSTRSNRSRRTRTFAISIGSAAALLSLLFLLQQNLLYNVHCMMELLVR